MFTEIVEISTVSDHIWQNFTVLYTVSWLHPWQK